MKERPENYPEFLPRSIKTPKVPLFEVLKTSSRRFPDNGLIYYGKNISYSQLWNESLNLAGYLFEKGIEKGDRIAVCSPNTPQIFISLFGISRANAVGVPINALAGEREWKYLLKDSGSEILITIPELAPAFKEVIEDTQVREIIIGRHERYLQNDPDLPLPDLMQLGAELPEEVTEFEEIMSQTWKAPEVQVGHEDYALIPYTAGTTGEPKGCLHTNSNLLHNAQAAGYWFTRTPSNVEIAVAPWFHVTGIIHSLLSPVYFGSEIIPLAMWDPETCVQAIEKYGVTGFVGVPTMIIDILDLPDIEERDLSSLMTIGGGGAAIPVPVAEKLKEMTGLEYMEGDGLTEIASNCHFNPPRNPKFGSVGISSPDIETKIIDVDTNEVLPPNEEGELVVKSPAVLEEYWNKPEETEEAFIEIDGEEYLKTGDLYYRDEDDYYYIVDRIKRMINRAGENVWPAAIEDIIHDHPAIKEACIVKTPDDRVGEEVKAYVVLKSEYEGEVDEEDIKDWSRDHMAGHQWPREVEFLEELPTSGAGKVLWRDLEEKEK